MQSSVLHRAHHVVRNYFLHILCGTLVLMSGSLLVYSAIQASGSILFLDSFNYPSGLITNEYAHWNSTDPSAKTNADWDLTSGSLFEQNGAGWSGVPDDTSPNATSSNGTNSAVFRLNTKRFDFGDVKVSFKLFQNGLVTTPSTPAVDWDGIHIFLRYQSEYNLYYASVNRRDGRVVIKKKCVGGTSNGGTYYELGNEITGHPIPYGTWQNVAASVQNNADGSVTINLYREGVLLDSGTDSGIGCAVIRSAGATGIRGDNDNFLFDDFTVESLATSATPAPTASPAPGTNSGGGTGTTGKTTASPTPTASARASASPTPSSAAKSGSSSATNSSDTSPAPLSPAVLTKAARTEPTFWAALVAAALAVILAALLVHDHRQTRRLVSGPRRR